MQQNIIWTNDTDQIDAIIDDWKQEAAHLATAMAENPKETMADATYGVDVILGKAGLWNGSRTIASVVRFDNIGDIISDSPWTGMEYETWKIDGHDDLRYVGVHHDGVNTCTFRELKTDGHGEKPIEENDLRALLRASRPLGPLVREVYGMPAPAKKHGNR